MNVISTKSSCDAHGSKRQEENMIQALYGKKSDCRD